MGVLLFSTLMPAESSFADILGRAVNLKDALATMSPVFAPSDTTVNAGNFAAFLGTVEVANEAVAAAGGAYTVLATEREALLKVIKKTATRVINYLKSNDAFAPRLKAATQAADKLRGVNTKRPKLPPPPPGGEVPKVRSKGDMSYMDAQGHFKSVIDAVTGLAGYAPTPVGNPITLANLNATLSGFKGQNAGISSLETAYTEEVVKRQTLYTGKGKLRDKFKKIKNAVAAQYGRESGEFASVAGINY